MDRPRAFYLGVFLTSFSALVYQVATTRILSVLTWYHLAFLSISLAMLGITAAGLYVYLLVPNPSAERTRGLLVNHSLWFAASLPLCHLALISLALPSELHLQATALASLGLAVILAALPFFFSGVVIAVALTQTPLPTGRVYGVDLVGASLGCLAAVGLLGFLDPSTICLLLGALAGAAAAAFCLATGRRVPRLVLAFAVALAALAGVNGVSYPHLVRVTRMGRLARPLEQPLSGDRLEARRRIAAVLGTRLEPARRHRSRGREHRHSDRRLRLHGGHTLRRRSSQPGRGAP